jgi:capsular polysaccharide biosynthesis protein
MLKKEKKLLYPESTVIRGWPINLSGGPSTFIKDSTQKLPEVSLFSYSNVNVTPEGLVFKNLKLDADLFIYPSHKSTYNLLYLLSSLVKRKKVKLKDEKFLLIFDYWSNSIFHWMCDALPRLEAVKDMAKDCVLLLPEFFRYTYIHDTLKAFEFKDIHLLKNSELVNCTNLYAPGHVTVSGQMRPSNIVALRKTLLQYFQPQFRGNLNHPNIYISRKKAKYRKVINEEAMVPILKQHNFEIICFEDFTTAEQVELSYNARNIISIHGANLTNIIFMQEKGRVLEFRKKEDILNNYFYELADSVSCSYYYLDCDFEDPIPNKNFFSLYVDADQLDIALKKITNGG